MILGGRKLGSVFKDQGSSVERRGNNLNSFKDFRTENGSRRGQNLAVTGSFATSSLDSWRAAPATPKASPAWVERERESVRVCERERERARARERERGYGGSAALKSEATAATLQSRETRPLGFSVERLIFLGWRVANGGGRIEEG